MSTRIPHLLLPYLNLPPSSLTLLTSVLGATTNWLLLRYLAYHLAPRIADDEGTSHGLRRAAREDGEGVEGQEKGRGEGEGDTAVVLVSFMRDYAFWKDGAARLGLDLDLAARSSTFTFVDGLTSLFVPPPPEQLPRGRRVLCSAKLEDVTRELSAAVEELRGGGKKVLLIVDQPDCFLAVGGAQVTSLGLNDAILSLREKVNATIVSISADEPLIEPQNTTLERSHASFALAAAHEARLVLSCRMLDTGVASDVSGVLRIARGGGWEEDVGEGGDEDGEAEGEVEGHEYLYHVGSDWGVKVFERGQG